MDWSCYRCNSTSASRHPSEGFQLAQDGAFQVGFIVALAWAEEIEEVRFLKDNRRRGFVGTRDGERGPLGDANFATLVGLAFDLPVQFAFAPMCGHALPGVEVAGGLALERQQLQEMCPTQLSHQRCDNFGIREGLGELLHAAQVPCRKSRSTILFDSASPSRSAGPACYESMQMQAEFDYPTRTL